jgi:polysaccharide biosynthesis transport protein
MNINPAPFRFQAGMRPGPLPGADRRAGTSGTWTITHVVDATLRRRRTVGLVALLCFAAAAAYAHLAAPTYTTMASVVLDTKLTPPSPGTVSSETTIDPAVVDSQVEILRSDKIALDVVDRLKLARDPEFVGAEPSFARALLDRALSLFETGPEGSVRADPRQAAAAALGRKVKVTRAGRSILAEITVTSLDPLKAAAIANAVAEAYIQDQLGSRMEASQRTTDWMQRRLSEVRDRLDAANAALAAFRAGEDGAGGAARGTERAEREGSRPGAVDALARARADLDRLTQLRAALAQGDSGAETLARIDQLGDPDLSKLVAEQRAAAPGTPSGTALGERLDARIETRRKEVAAAELRATLLDRQIRDLGTAPDKDAGRERALERAVQDAQSNYEALQNRVMRVSAFLQQQSMPVTEARIVTTALPPLSKSAPKSSLILLLGLIGGLGAGVAAAFLREAFDQRVRWSRQITHELGQPFLGSLAACPARGQEFRHVSDDPQGGDERLPVPLFIANGSGSPAVLETLCTTKVSIDQALHRETCRVVGIVSANAAEGKSTLVTNLAVLLVEMRARVLVVDADLHGPGLAELAAGDPGPGLARAVTQRRSLAECVVASRLGFHLLPGTVGPVPSHPVEILGSAALRQLLAEAREHYDYVLIEVPPVLSAVDARVVSDLIDAFVLVVREGRTRRDEVEHAFTTCPAIADRIVGVVMNRTKSAARPAPASAAPAYLQGAA